MKSIEEMKAEQAKAIAKLEKEHALAALCPVPPKSVQITSASLGHWISYRADSLYEAVELMAKFKPITFYKYKGTYTRFVPEPLNVGKDKGDEVDGPYVVKLDVSQGERFGPTVYMAFFFYAGDDICMARIELQKGYHSTGGAYGASFVADSRGQGKRLDGRDAYKRGHWQQNSRLAGMMDSVIKWASGDEKSAHFTYYMAADYEAGDYQAGTDEASARLLNIAEAMHGAREESAE